MDVMTGAVDGGPSLDAGRKCHHLVEVLVRDFYQPLKLGELFAELFPAEHFDVYSSPNRVHQLLFRTRAWMKSEKIPVEIKASNGDYALICTGDFAFRVPAERRPVDGYHQYLEKLRQVFNVGEEFSQPLAREKLRMPRTTFFRFSKWAVEAGKLEKIVSLRSTSYRLKPADESAVFFPKTAA